MIFAIINDEETTYSIKELWQYDYGQVLRIQNLNTEKYAIEIHFSTEENFGESITRIATNNGGSFDVTIPDSVLENKCASKDYFIYAFIYITGQSSGNTIKKIIIPVRSRPKPEGREQNDNNTMTAILKAVNSIADGKADGLKYEDDTLSLMAGEKNIASVTITGGLGSGTDGREVELQNNGIHIQWRYEGEESWTNLIALEDIKGPAGPAGEKGDPGAITPEQISGAVEEYFASNQIQAGATEDQARQIEKNTQDISKLSDEIADLKENGNGIGSGVTTAQAESLWALVQKTAFAEQLTDEELNAFKTAWGIVEVVIPATGISLDKSTLSFTDSSSQTLIATVEPSNSTDSVTWETSDAGIATVSSGVVSPVSNGSCTITAKAGSYSVSCEVTVNVSEEIVTLQSISATYTGGDVTVGTALTDLTGITVTGTYSDGSTSAITDYTLSGTIAEGNNTITVTYEGLTTTFTVVGYVEEVETTEPVYQLAEAVTFDGTNYVDTGYILNDVDKDWSICVDWTPSARSGVVFDASKQSTYGPILLCKNNWSWQTYLVTIECTPSTSVNRQRLIIAHSKGSGTFEHYWIEDGGISITEKTATLSNYDKNSNIIGQTKTMILGQSLTDSTYYPYSGTINTFLVYERVLTSDEINVYMGV